MPEEASTFEAWRTFPRPDPQRHGRLSRGNAKAIYLSGSALCGLMVSPWRDSIYMPTPNYHVTLPSGETRGPLTLQEIKEQALEGKLPRESIVRGELGTFTVPEIVTIALGQPARAKSRTGEVPVLEATQASTPRAKRRSAGNA